MLPRLPRVLLLLAVGLQRLPRPLDPFGVVGHLVPRRGLHLVHPVPLVVVQDGLGLARRLNALEDGPELLAESRVGVLQPLLYAPLLPAVVLGERLYVPRHELRLRGHAVLLEQRVQLRLIRALALPRARQEIRRAGNLHVRVVRQVVQRAGFFWGHTGEGTVTSLLLPANAWHSLSAR